MPLPLSKTSSTSQEPELIVSDDTARYDIYTFLTSLLSKFFDTCTKSSEEDQTFDTITDRIQFCTQALVVLTDNTNLRHDTLLAKLVGAFQWEPNEINEDCSTRSSVETDNDTEAVGLDDVIGLIVEAQSCLTNLNDALTAIKKK